MKLWQKMLLGVGLGVVAGFILGPKAEYVKPVGTLFLGLLNMLVIPLVFSSLTSAVTSIEDIKKLGRVGLKTLVLFALTTAVAIVIGLSFAYLFNPGKELHLLPPSAPLQAAEKPSLLSVVLSLVPQNPFGSLASGNILQVIVFALLLGVGINFAGEKAKPVARVLESLSEAMLALTSLLMRLAPYGLFAIMAWVSGTFGLSILYPLLKLVVAHYLACIFHSVVVFGGILVFLVKMSPRSFFRGMRDAITVAATTTSSTATLPATLHCVQKNLGVSKSIASFILPLGATINMNGTAIFQGIAALFIAQVYGIDLGWQSLLMIVVSATLSAVGCAGIPGGALVTLSIVLSAVGLPIEGVALIAGIDRLRDIIGTVLNVTGDAVVAVYVAKSEGELDESCLNKERVAYDRAH